MKKVICGTVVFEFGSGHTLQVGHFITTTHSKLPFRNH